MKFIKKPVAIEAFQLTMEKLKELRGGNDNNYGLVFGNITYYKNFAIIQTLEGAMRAEIGDWIITGVNGEQYPCKPDIFDKTYIGEDKIGEISDGYHTFDELYDHRIMLFIALCRNYPCWRSKRHSGGELAFGGEWFVMGIFQSKGGQITYHIPIDRWEETNFAETLEKAPEWDGHTSADVLERLKNL